MSTGNIPKTANQIVATTPGLKLADLLRLNPWITSGTFTIGAHRSYYIPYVPNHPGVPVP
jgi:hypothetical protein